jgi:hypothetical protein
MRKRGEKIVVDLKAHGITQNIIAVGWATGVDFL